MVVSMLLSEQQPESLVNTIIRNLRLFFVGPDRIYNQWCSTVAEYVFSQSPLNLRELEISRGNLLARWQSKVQPPLGERSRSWWGFGQLGTYSRRISSSVCVCGLLVVLVVLLKTGDEDPINLALCILLSCYHVYWSLTRTHIHAHTHRTRPVNQNSSLSPCCL